MRSSRGKKSEEEEERTTISHYEISNNNARRCFSPSPHSLCRGTQIYKTYSYIVKSYVFPVAPSGKRTWLLTGMYPEGAPNHPAMPSGHATVNGATTTILKAMFKTVDDNGNAITWDEATNDSM